MIVNVKNFNNQLLKNPSNQQLIKLKENILSLHDITNNDLLKFKEGLIKVKNNVKTLKYPYLGICGNLYKIEHAYNIMELFAKIFYEDTDLISYPIPKTKHRWKYSGLKFRLQYIDWIIKQIDVILSL